MPELELFAPTYYGDAAETTMAAGSRSEFDEPHVPILVRPADGLRIVLGSHDYFSANVPDILIERRPGGWVVFLHLNAGDPSGLVILLDDGRSFLIPEPNGVNHPTVTLEAGAVIPELDEINPR